MKRTVSILALAALLLTSVSAFAFEKGEEVELCHDENGYNLLAPEAECTGNVVGGKVLDIMGKEVVVELPEGETVTLPVE